MDEWMDGWMDSGRQPLEVYFSVCLGENASIFGPVRILLNLIREPMAHLIHCSVYTFQSSHRCSDRCNLLNSSCEYSG